MPDTERTHNATCPYCGHTNWDSGEIGGGGPGDFDSKCDECGKTFRVTRHTRITYSTRKREETPNA